MPADAVSAPLTASPMALNFLTRHGHPTALSQRAEQAENAGNNVHGISPWPMMKASSPQAGYLRCVLHCLPDSRGHSVAHRSNLLNYIVLLSLLPFSDSFPHSPSVLPGITFQINSLP